MMDLANRQYKTIKRQAIFIKIRNLIIIAFVAYCGYFVAMNPQKVGEFFGKIKSGYTTTTAAAAE